MDSGALGSRAGAAMGSGIDMGGTAGGSRMGTAACLEPQLCGCTDGGGGGNGRVVMGVEGGSMEIVGEVYSTGTVTTGAACCRVCTRSGIG